MIGFVFGGAASGFGQRIVHGSAVCGMVAGGVSTDSSPGVGLDVELGSRPQRPSKVLFVPAIGASGRNLQRVIRGIEDAEVVRWRQDSEEKDLKELVVDVLESRKGSTWTVVAESTGGTLALMMACKGMEEIEKLVLVNPVTSPRSEIAKIGVRAPAPLQRIFSAIGPMASTSMKTVSNSDISFTDSQLSRINVPVTIVVSEDDILQPSYAESQRLLNLIPQAVRCVLPSGGHFLLSENKILLSQILVKSQHIFDSAKIPQKRADSDDMVDINPKTLENARGRFAFLRRMVSPVIIGGNRISHLVPGDQPILFVGNHTLYGLFDLPFLVDHFLEERSILVRGLAHPLVFQSDRSRKKDKEKENSFMFEDFGAVQVSPRNFYALMKEKKWTLLFPGGIREAHHRKNEKYKTIWPEEQEFVRTAAKFGALIVPFASVGSDDNFEMLMDGNDLMNIPQVANWLKDKPPVKNARSWKQNDDEDKSLLPPLSRPRRPSRLYTRFGHPIDLADVDYRDKQLCQDIYQEVRSSVETLIETQLEARERDRYGDLARRLAFETINEVPAPTDLQWSIRGSYIPAEDLPT